MSGSFVTCERHADYWTGVCLACEIERFQARLAEMQGFRDECERQFQARTDELAASQAREAELRNEVARLTLLGEAEVTRLRTALESWPHGGASKGSDNPGRIARASLAPSIAEPCGVQNGGALTLPCHLPKGHEGWHLAWCGGASKSWASIAEPEEG